MFAVTFECRVHDAMTMPICTLPHADTSLKFPHRTSGGPTNW